MDIFITEIATGKRVTLPMLPKEVKVNSDGRFESFESVTLGDIEFPKGTALQEVSFEVIFPGVARRDSSLVHTHLWQRPDDFILILDTWRKAGAKLKLLVTNTRINFDVYLMKFSHTYSGGMGDIKANLDFIEAKDLRIYNTKELNIKPKIKKVVRPASPASSSGTYTVVAGDTLWGIAARFLGNGARWPEIYNLNKDIIKNPNLIYVGQVLKLPTGSKAAAAPAKPVAYAAVAQPRVSAPVISRRKDVKTYKVTGPGGGNARQMLMMVK